MNIQQAYHIVGIVCSIVITIMLMVKHFPFRWWRRSKRDRISKIQCELDELSLKMDTFLYISGKRPQPKHETLGSDLMDVLYYAKRRIDQLEKALPNKTFSDVPFPPKFRIWDDKNQRWEQ